MPPREHRMERHGIGDYRHGHPRRLLAILLVEYHGHLFEPISVVWKRIGA